MSKKEVQNKVSLFIAKSLKSMTAADCAFLFSGIEARDSSK